MECPSSAQSRPTRTRAGRSSKFEVLEGELVFEVDRTTSTIGHPARSRSRPVSAYAISNALHHEDAYVQEFRPATPTRRPSSSCSSGSRTKADFDENGSCALLTLPVMVDASVDVDPGRHRRRGRCCGCWPRPSDRSLRCAAVPASQPMTAVEPDRDRTEAAEATMQMIRSPRGGFCSDQHRHRPARHRRHRRWRCALSRRSAGLAREVRSRKIAAADSEASTCSDLRGADRRRDLSPSACCSRASRGSRTERVSAGHGVRSGCRRESADHFVVVPLVYGLAPLSR